MTREKEKAESKFQLEKLKAALGKTMLAKMTLEFSMRMQTSKKPKDEEKWNKLVEEEASALAAVEELQKQMKWQEGDFEEEEDEEESEEEKEEPKKQEEQEPRVVKPPARNKPQTVKPPVPVFHEPPRKSTEEGVPWREDTRRKREEGEFGKESNKRQKSESPAKEGNETG